jgi:hypothetical protein
VAEATRPHFESRLPRLRITLFRSEGGGEYRLELRFQRRSCRVLQAPEQPRSVSFGPFDIDVGSSGSIKRHQALTRPTRSTFSDCEERRWDGYEPLVIVIEHTRARGHEDDDRKDSPPEVTRTPIGMEAAGQVRRVQSRRSATKLREARGRPHPAPRNPNSAPYPHAKLCLPRHHV